jgi:hypothetical protein
VYTAAFNADDDTQIDGNPVYLALGPTVGTKSVAGISIPDLLEELRIFPITLLSSIRGAISDGSMPGWCLRTVVVPMV